MSHDRVQIEQSEGAKSIQQFCYDLAKRRGLVLKSVDWAFDLSSPSESEHILTITGRTDGAAEVTFSRTDIESYPSGRNVKKTNEKVSKAIEELSEIDPPAQGRTPA